MDKPVRRPFALQGALWVSVGSGCRDGTFSHEAYRLVHPSQFEGTPTTYREKLQDADAARADALGFYHGMTVKSAGERLILCGPPARFVAGATQQLDLFG